MRSDAQKRADSNYKSSDKNKYRTIAASLHIDQAQKIKAAAEKCNISTSKYIVLACKYCIDNDVDLCIGDENTTES